MHYTVLCLHDVKMFPTYHTLFSVDVLIHTKLLISILNLQINCIFATTFRFSSD